MEVQALYKKILLPTDGSENAEKAADHGLALAKSVGANVLFLYVMDTSSFVSLPETLMWENVKNLLEKEGKKALENVKTKAKKKNVKSRALIKEGSPSKQVVQTARDEKVDLIVMGTAGRTGLDRFFLGSVSEKVLRSADCPVMVVK